MGKGFFKTNIASQNEKNKGPEVPQNATSISDDKSIDSKEKCATEPHSTVSDDEDAPAWLEKKQAPEAPKKTVKLYGDVSVCNYLRIKRRILAAAKKIASRGSDWNCVGHHSGMTEDWIERYLQTHRITPSGSLEQIATDSKVVSVRICGFSSENVVIVERISDGARLYARVRDLSSYPMYLRETFDAIEVNGHLEWSWAPNKCVY